MIEFASCKVKPNSTIQDRLMHIPVCNMWQSTNKVGKASGKFSED